jgi:hypothetical protein
MIPSLDVGQQRPSPDRNRCWGDRCYAHRGPQRPIAHWPLGLCQVCLDDIMGEE